MMAKWIKTMNVEQLKTFCMSLAGTSINEYNDSRNLLSYALDDKKFAYFKTSDPERWRFSIRVSPERFLELTDQDGIKPARYMHRFHWISIVNVVSIDEDYLKELITYSYHKAMSSLSKKRQKELIS